MLVTGRISTNMPYEPFKFPLTGGYDRTQSPLIADKASFYRMQNIRQSTVRRGMLEQTPRFTLTSTVSQGSYRPAGVTLTEPTTSAVRYWDNRIIVTDFCLSLLSGLQQVVISQTTVPAGTGVTKGCLLELVNPTAASITIGSTYDIEIDGAATFRWRVNGGAWTALVAIDAAAGNLIDGGNARVYWLASTGFTVTDLWQFKRTNWTDANSGVPLRVLTVGNSIYYVGASLGRVMKVEYLPSLGVAYGRTVGYRPVYASTLNLFENHLFCFGLQADLTTPGGSWVQNSDLNNLDNFIPTDTNEADYYNIVLVERGNTLNSLYVLDGAVLQSRLYIYTSAGIYYTDYAGLPTPFSFKFLLTFPATQSTQATGYMLETPYGIYIVTGIGIYRFDGAGLSQLVDFIPFGISIVYGMFYNAYTREIIFINGSDGSWLVYQPLYGTFYVRAASFDSQVWVSGVSAGNGAWRLGINSRRLVTEDTGWAAATVLNDTNSGGSLFTPILVTQTIGGDTMMTVKENQPLYVVADVLTTTSGTAYSTSTNIQLAFSIVPFAGYNVPATALYGTPESMGTWTSASADGSVSTSRTSYRAAGYQMTIVGLDGPKPAGRIFIHSLECSTYVVRSATPTR